MTFFGFSEKKLSNAVLRLFVQVFRFKIVSPKGFPEAYTLLGIQTIEKIGNRLSEFLILAKGFHENFWQVYHQKSFEHSREHYKNTQHWKFLNFNAKCGAARKFLCWLFKNIVFSWKGYFWILRFRENFACAKGVSFSCVVFVSLCRAEKHRRGIFDILKTFDFLENSILIL